MTKRRPESVDLDELLHRRAKHKANATHEQRHDEREDASRSSVANLLARCLRHESDEDGTAYSSIAVAIEQELYTLHGGSSSRAYKCAVRNLTANLKRNTSLVSRITGEELSPAQLVRLQPCELATATQQAQLARSHDKLLRAATIYDSAEKTGDHTCPECKSNACSEASSVSVVAGKSDTWGAKQHEGKGPVITCLTCGFKWEASVM